MRNRLLRLKSKLQSTIKTPVKALPKTSNQPYVCRCCNSGFANNPIDLFGLKAESENLLDLLNNLTGLKFCDSDGCGISTPSSSEILAKSGLRNNEVSFRV